VLPEPYRGDRDDEEIEAKTQTEARQEGLLMPADQIKRVLRPAVKIFADRHRAYFPDDIEDMAVAAYKLGGLDAVKALFERAWLPLETREIAGAMESAQETCNGCPTEP
jgi:hypothetical protein